MQLKYRGTPRRAPGPHQETAPYPCLFLDRVRRKDKMYEQLKNRQWFFAFEFRLDRMPSGTPA
ncbi:hypothetical protein EKH55_1959 [Sinorhizobium alkalisoli]|nr:hypothetical protein EKH55_1959 [Sinorhizobium alkalisoli]